MNKRIIVIVLDSVGIGEMPDAWEYGDQGSNTLGNTSEKVGGIRIPNLVNLGIANITDIPLLPSSPKPEANYGKMQEASKGKDTTTGHWELAGIILDKSFPTFPNGFPQDFIKEFEKKIGRKVIGNEVASGTEIIERLGPDHLKTGSPIVYTSADSVFQIAAHEEIIPLEDLLDICKTARNMLIGELMVSRVIARPFIGRAGSFQRTANRHDFSIKPIRRTVLDSIVDNNLTVAAVGKINDIFAGQGISEYIPTKNNMDGVDKTIKYIERNFSGMIFTNLVDFDTLYGHRNNVEGYAKALEEFDSRIPEILDVLKPEDILIITSDHGCDPTTSSTDHSREYVPLLVYGKKLKKGINLGLRKTFADVAATIAEYLEVERLHVGESFLNNIKGVS
ncbi:MAG: phosphopentomutase [Peptococcaceae bacterium]|nr:phosphopentomutase [Peptococcaceae bacterium]